MLFPENEKTSNLEQVVASAKHRKTNPEFSSLISNAGNTLIVPDPELINQIEAESFGKIEYVPTDRIAFENQGDTYNYQGSYNKFIFSNILQKLDDEFPDKNIALRAVAASVNGPINSPAYSSIVLDATEIASKGTEKDGPFCVVWHMHGKTSVTENYGLKHSSEYATRVGSVEKGYGVDASSIFPAILAYDADQLEPDPNTGGRYNVRFKKGVTADKALLKVFVTDKVGKSISINRLPEDIACDDIYYFDDPL